MLSINYYRTILKMSFTKNDKAKNFTASPQLPLISYRVMS